MNIYLSPSTQENNVGYGSYGTEEKRMNELADIVQPLLTYNGFNVFRNKPSMSLRQVINDSNSKIGHNGLHVALHTNAGGGFGTEIWYNTGSVVGKKLASDIYSFVAPITPSDDRGIKSTTRLSEVDDTFSPAVIVEVIFHDNKNDALYMVNNMEEVAIAIVKGICKHVNQTYKAMLREEPKEELNGDTFYRVVTGSFIDRENAEKRIKDLLEKGFVSFIDIYNRK